MNIAVFDTRSYDRAALAEVNQTYGHKLTFFEPKLNLDTVALVDGHEAVCSFIHDDLSADVLQKLKDNGVRLIDLRSAGFNHVDLDAAQKLGLKVAYAPEYSPHAVAEHAVALVLILNRKIHKAYLRELTGNFSLEGMVGFDLKGKTVGVVGTGKIGRVFAHIMAGFGCRIVGYDVQENEELKQNIADFAYVGLDELFARSDIISLHTPLTPETKHILDQDAFAKMKDGAMVINTGRGALIDTQALIGAIKAGKLGSAGLDVYEEEEGIFHEDLSAEVIPDDLLAQLLMYQNVLITSHQAFLTREALHGIAVATLENARQFEDGEEIKNEVRLQ